MCNFSFWFIYCYIAPKEISSVCDFISICFLMTFLVIFLISATFVMFAFIPNMFMLSHSFCQKFVTIIWLKNPTTQQTSFQFSWSSVVLFSFDPMCCLEVFLNIQTDIFGYHLLLIFSVIAYLLENILWFQSFECLLRLTL